MSAYITAAGAGGRCTCVSENSPKKKEKRRDEKKDAGERESLYL